MFPMSMKPTAFTSTMAALALFTLAPTAAAQTTTHTSDYTEQRGIAGDQVVKFTGDELAAPPGSASGNIMVRTGPIRVPLIRPRLNFVPELLKSVENL